MAHIFEGTNGNYCEAFIDSLRALRDKGRITSPRGQKTLELDHVVFKVDPRKTLYASPRRNLNFFFLIVENLWYWSGRNSTELPSYYVRNYRDFSDEGVHQGAYGPMILEQIRHVVNTLKSDTDSRQAVMTLWRPNPHGSKDTPCTISFDFKIRDGKLNMHATMRSNDAIWGNNYDIPSFSMIQLAIAGILGVPSGNLFLTAHSYHVYERHFDLMKELISEEWNYSEYPKELELLPCSVGSLENHIANIETLLGAHYTSKMLASGDFDNLTPFYRQFELMMKLFNTKKHGLDSLDYYVEKLIDIGSPFGIIYNDRLLNKKK